MLAKSAKLRWGMGHQELKVICSGAVEPVLTYGAPVWEIALTKQLKERSAKNDEYKNSQGIQNSVI
jgi:hypothetical protein